MFSDKSLIIKKHSINQSAKWHKYTHKYTCASYLDPPTSFWILGCIDWMFGFDHTFSVQFISEDSGIHHLLVSCMSSEVSEPGLTFLDCEAASGVSVLQCRLLGFLPYGTWCRDHLRDFEVTYLKLWAEIVIFLIMIRSSYDYLYFKLNLRYIFKSNYGQILAVWVQTFENKSGVRDTAGKVNSDS